MSRTVTWYVVAIWYVAVSLLTFVVYWRDKRAAVLGGGRRRVAERTLHLLALAGGAPGALIAQQFLRHKRRKVWFMAVTVLITVVHVVGWGAWVWWRMQG